MMRWVPAALVLSLLLALVLRLPDLGRRPFHNDEAVNALKCCDLLERGIYRYDPNEFHGPTLHYATRLFAWLGAWPAFEDTSEARFRLLNVLFGAALIPLLWLTRDALGRKGTVWAALLTAISPSLVFYSRDYIHEILLVAFTFAFIGCVWRYTRRPRWGWALAAGAAAGLMHATKETVVLNLGAMAVAGAGLWAWQGFPPGPAQMPRGRIFRHMLALLAGAVVVSIVLFSSFGQNLQGPLDSVRTYAPWLGRAGGDSPHVHPWWFYAQRWLWAESGGRMPWTELGFLVLAGIGLRAACTGRGLGDAHPMFLRALGLYAATLFLAYSILPYKTPWCILGVVHAVVLLGGVGLSVLWFRAGRLRWRVALGVLTAGFLMHSAWQASVLSDPDPDLPSRPNPWGYAETAPDLENLVQLVDDLAAVSPRGRALDVQVVCAEDDYWPLPYLLRRYSRVGWWSAIPPLPWAPVRVVSREFIPRDGEASGYVNGGAFQLRDGVFLWCYVERSLWDAFLEGRGSD